VSRPTLVVHAALLSHGPLSHGPRVGFVVSGAVGNAVTRNRVKRRLRHLAAAQLADTDLELGVVVRALPRASADPDAVPTDFGSAWHEAMSRLMGPDVMKHRVR
jgi:ribonuclease P protein component